LMALGLLVFDCLLWSPLLLFFDFQGPCWVEPADPNRPHRKIYRYHSFCCCLVVCCCSISCCCRILCCSGAPCWGPALGTETTTLKP
jgi:hypothetical protein